MASQSSATSPAPSQSRSRKAALFGSRDGGSRTWSSSTASSAPRTSRARSRTISRRRTSTPSSSMAARSMARLSSTASDFPAACTTACFQWQRSCTPRAAASLCSWPSRTRTRPSRFSQSTRAASRSPTARRRSLTTRPTTTRLPSGSTRPGLRGRPCSSSRCTARAYATATAILRQRRSTSQPQRARSSVKMGREMWSSTSRATDRRRRRSRPASLATGRPIRSSTYTTTSGCSPRAASPTRSRCPARPRCTWQPQRRRPTRQLLSATARC
mmetsp:Transcript_18859/g.44468  ORF Transcript_18859/g.44468 Transcript_18859/m.44468 type:complete len:272 (-) Transcript_18859:642-1457(-)